MTISSTLKLLTIFMLIYSSSAWSFLGIHSCPQQHQCVYYRGGKLLNSTNGPGWHLKVPFLDSHYPVQTTWQTDSLNQVPCMSNQGSIAYLNIEVINKLKGTHDCIMEVIGEYGLDYDSKFYSNYVPSEVSQFCKDYSIGDILIREKDKLDDIVKETLTDKVKDYGLENCLNIKDVRISNIHVDNELRRKFEAIEREQKDRELAVQKKETDRVNQEAITEKEISKKKREQETSKIELIIQKEKAIAEAEHQKIIDEMLFHKKQKEADATKYAKEKEAEGNEMLFKNPNYVKLEGYRAAHNNAKLVFCDIPQNALLNFGNTQDVVEKKIIKEHIESGL